MSLLSQLWWTGVRAAGGELAVSRALQVSAPGQATEVLAVGKAAASMCAGALNQLPAGTPALVVTKQGHGNNLREQHPQVELIEAGHPIPDERSLLAGQRLYERIRACDESARLLMLVSGGASALAERLPPGRSLVDWQQKTAALVASGQSIEAINTERSKLSLVKSGRLLKAFPGCHAQVLAISDVQGDSMSVIGSGLGDTRYLNCSVTTEVVATNAMAREAIAMAAVDQGIEVQENSETLYQDVFVAARQMASRIYLGPPGLYVWGGEPTIELPANPGRGGRNQSLALALARELLTLPLNQSDPVEAPLDVEVLVAGTDGTDGPTSAAGGWLRNLGERDVQQLDAALELADAGTYLVANDELFVTGPTDTNVMDLALCLKR